MLPEFYIEAGILQKKSEQILQSWKPYSTVAVWYIWRVIDPDVVQY